MDDHEALHEQLEHEADDLQKENEHLGEQIEAAKDANHALEQDGLTATPLPEPGGEGGDPPPETQFTNKE